MHLVIITSLDALSRNSAASSMAQAFPDTPVILHDLLDDGVVARRIHRNEHLLERRSMVLEHGCLSCTVRLDLAPALLRLAAAGETRAIVGLPPGTTADNAIDVLNAVAPRVFAIDTVALAVCPDDVEDQLWDRHTLFESGYTAVPEDARTPGEFLVGEFLFTDTVLVCTSNLLSPDPGLVARGVQLIRELAPHARLASVFPATSRADLGTYDDEAARSRSRPGEVLVPEPGPGVGGRSPFRTVEHRIDRPLHPDRFRTALAAIAQGCCFVRGSVWMAGVSDTRIALYGVGPHIALANGGRWSSDARHGQWCRGTHIALTGDDLDDADLTGLLDACALTDEELQTMSVHEPSSGTSRTVEDHH